MKRTANNMRCSERRLRIPVASGAPRGRLAELGSLGESMTHAWLILDAPNGIHTAGNYSRSSSSISSNSFTRISEESAAT